MKHRYVIGIDPSGNYLEGKGTTGLAVYDRKADKFTYTGYVRAETFDSQMSYWKGVVRVIDLLLERYSSSVLSIEDYLLYSNAARSQINSTFETPQIIGVLKYAYCHKTIYTRHASAVKNRWKDDILLRKGYLRHNKRIGYYIEDEMGTATQVIEHSRDAMRHAVHCGKFEVKD